MHDSDANKLIVQRLVNQGLQPPHSASPAEAIARLGAVQAQDYPGAKWGLGLRLPNSLEADIDKALNAGDILRTHAMRPTWHFVAPADIRWLLELTAPRVHAVNAGRYRDLELDAATLARAGNVLTRALQGGRHLTRPELSAALAAVGISATGQRLGYILHYAELERLICSGPRCGKQFTYALLDERAPAARSLPREEALAELTRRFFTSHGPAQIKDFAWWSGLTQADVKTGLAQVNAEIISETVAEREYWRAGRQPAPAATIPPALLLPAYDEFTIAYKDHTAVLHPHHPLPPGDPIFNSLLLIEGRVLGFWRRMLTKGAAVIETAPFRPLSAEERAHLATAAQRYSQFIGLPVRLA